MSYPVQSGAGGSWPTAADGDLRSGFDSGTWRRPWFGPVVGGVCNIDVRTGLASCRMAPTPFLGVLND